MAKPQRAFAFIAALLLFISTVGFSGLVIWQMNQADDTESQSQELSDLPPEVQAQLKAQQEAGQQGDTKLEGTQLQNFTPVTDVTELQIIDLQEGTGQVVPEGGSVVAHYTGAIAKTGKIFQSSLDGGQPIPFSLNGVIPGWTKGVPGMKVGGKRRLIIPANMAYGEQGNPQGGIGPNEPLVFDIELTAVQ